MKILFLTRSVYPKVGGVEKHISEISKYLKILSHKVIIISEKDIKYPKVKFLGLLSIWLWLFRNRRIIKDSDIVHCHDVFIWYLPFRFLYPNKKVFTTFHGWEGVWPIPLKNIILKRIANKLSWGSFAVGKYIEKYYSIRTNKILYGGTTKISANIQKIKNTIIWIGRLEKDTGLLSFLTWLDSNRKYKVSFLGDGILKERCMKYGKVYGFVDPKSFLRKSEICVPVGYLSYIEAKSYDCKIMTFSDNPLKRDYWSQIKKVKKFPSWKEVAYEYINLYNSFK